MSVLYYAQQYITTKLSVGGGINDSQTTGIVIQSTTGIDTTKPGIVCLSWSDPLDTDLYEYISYTSIDGSNELQGVTRGAEGSTARSHLNQADIAWVVTESHINNINDKLEGIDTDGVKLVEINDTNGNEQIKFVTTTSAVNELTVTNAATGGSPEISATGSDTNIHIAIKGKGNGLVKVSVLTQNNTTNAYKNNSVILTGWGFILGNSGVAMSESVTFGITFSEAPVVVIGGAGQRLGSDPSAIGDLNGQPGYVMAETYSITTTGFSAGLSRATTGAGGAQSFTNTIRYGYNWIAIGAFN